MKALNPENKNENHPQTPSLHTARQEQEIPSLAVAAIAVAAKRARDSGLKRVIATDAQVIEVAPDGRRRVVKNIEPGVVVKKGQTFKLR